MRVGILSKCWKRPALTALFLDYYGSLHVPGVRFVCVAACSPAEDHDAAILMETGHPAWEFVPAPNHPLADKGNAACEQMKAHNPDLVINVGSDDFITPQYVRTVIAEVLAGKDYIVPSEVFFYEPATHRACRQTNNHGLKAGAAVSRSLLDKKSWQPWTAGGERPDTDMDRRLGPSYLLPEGSGVVMDVKAEEWLTSFDEFRGGNRFVKEADPDVLLGHFPGLMERYAGLSGLPV